VLIVDESGSGVPHMELVAMTPRTLPDPVFHRWNRTSHPHVLWPYRRRVFL
jgi:hypothetical protein